MAIRIVRLGTARNHDEGLRIGAVRRPPRSVRKEDYSKLDYYDVWMPELSPSPKLVSWALSKPFTAKRWSLFERRYRQEMRQPVPGRIATLLAALSSHTNFSLGCYCEDEARCHRSVLRQLLLEHGAKLAGHTPGS
jgi:uncharacterized protein YeaO (DUF488 family)